MFKCLVPIVVELVADIAALPQEILYVIFELAAALWASSERCCSLVYLGVYIKSFSRCIQRLFSIV
jgi:hypothetical protein